MEFLLEITTEEMPTSHIEFGLDQLRARFKEELDSLNIPHDKIETYGTCRRLVLVGDVAAKQKDKEEEIIGPPKSVAFTEDGSPTPGAKGFAKSKGVSVAKLKVIKTEKGEYVGIKKVIKGSSTRALLPEVLPRIISSLSFPKMMKWGQSSLRFSRPIKNLFCLFGQRMLSFSLEGISTSDFTTGHKIYFPQKIRVKSFPRYRDTLKRNKVVLNPKDRKKMILNQIERKLAPLEAQLLPDEQLLEKLVYDVEYPYVFFGKFPEEYLKLPLEILSTAMRVGQSLFSVVKGKKQLPYFIGVADAYKDPKSLIRKGNERVLIARLEDARFFWEYDFKVALQDRFKHLNKIIFQEKLGSYEDKAQRLKRIVSYLSDKLEVQKQKKEAIEAAELCKVDLLTEMVREFPSLQGKVGGLYAREQGYPTQVWKPIYEHYRPMSLDDESPSLVTGAIVSIADKIESIVGAVGTGIEVTGSKDPFGLRRNAQGVCKVILEKKFDFSFPRLLDKAVAVYGDRLERTKEEIKGYCLNFFKNRLQYIFERQGYRYDLINAALGPGIDNIYYASLRLGALDSIKESPQFEPLILIAKRVNNIIREQSLYKINSELFYEKEERELYTTFTIIRDNVLPLIANGDFSKAQKIVFRIRSSINNFFDHVLVMSEKNRIRRNRLALLQEISKLLIKIADYSQIVVEG